MSISLMEILDKKILRRSLLDHPFYQDWQNGSLSIEDLRIYAREYYHFESNFPRLLSSIHSRCPETKVRQVILDNLWDEEHGEKNHSELWLDFCAGLGLNPADVKKHQPYKNTIALVGNYNEMCSNGSFQEALASIYAYEVQLPEVAVQKLAGLVKWYGISDWEPLEFFRIHSYMDVDHSRSEGRIISEYTLYSNQHGVKKAFQFGLDAWYEFLDGINEIRKNTGVV